MKHICLASLVILIHLSALAGKPEGLRCHFDGNGLSLYHQHTFNDNIGGFYFHDPKLNGWEVGAANFSDVSKNSEYFYAEIFARRPRVNENRYDSVHAPVRFPLTGFESHELTFQLDGLEGTLRCALLTP